MDKKYRIAFIIDDSLDRPDGVQQYVLAIGQWLSAQGHEVHYLTSTTHRRDLPNLHNLSNNMSVRFNGNNLHIPLPAKYKQIDDLFASKRFDILHVQMPYSPFLAGRVIRRAGVGPAVVGTFHIYPNSWIVSFGSRSLALWLRRSLRRFDQIMSVSQAAQDFALNTFGIKSVVVPNAIDVDKFRNGLPLHRPVNNKVHILYLGRLVPRKGCMLLMQAAAILRDQPDLPPFHISVCSRGPLLDRLKKFVKKHELNDIVSFEGFISEAEKPNWYASSDITVFPSNGGESFGIVLLEAMACGRAVVLGGNNPGYRSVLEKCPWPVLFDPKNPKAFADHIRDMLIDKVKKSNIINWQYNEVPKYDIDVVGKQILEQYTLALQRHR